MSESTIADIPREKLSKKTITADHQGGSSSPLLDVNSTQPQAANIWHRPRSGRSTNKKAIAADHQGGSRSPSAMLNNFERSEHYYCNGWRLACFLLSLLWERTEVRVE